MQDEQMTLEEFSRGHMRLVRQMAIKSMVEDLARPNPFLEGYEPPTGWRRLRMRLREYSYRARDAWDVLLGRAEID